MLALASALFVLAFAPASLAKYQAFGTKWMASNRDAKPQEALSAWGERCERAHNNLKDNFPSFIAAVLILGALGRFDSSTHNLVLIWVIGRIMHFVAYALGNVPVRFMGYMMGIVSNLLLLAKVFIP